MNNIMKVGFMLVMSVMLISAININPQTVSAATKEELRDKIQNEISDKIEVECYDDFDGDGTKELFAVTGPGKDCENNQIWFANDSYVKCVYDNERAVYRETVKVCKVSARQKLFICETGGYGSGSSSECFYVSSGSVIGVEKCGEGLKQISGKKFYITPSAFDMNSNGEGHTWKTYYIKWTGREFKEYKVKQISLGKLKKYKNANKYINQARKLGYNVGDIYKRSNGIINVNLHKYDSRYDLVHNENITLRIKGKKVALVVDNKKGKNIIQKSSQAGSYQAYGLLW